MAALARHSAVPETAIAMAAGGDAAPYGPPPAKRPRPAADSESAGIGTATSVALTAGIVSRAFLAPPLPPSGVVPPPALDVRVLCSPVAFTGMAPRPRMMLLPVRKPRPRPAAAPTAGAGAAAAGSAPAGSDTTAALVVPKPALLTNLDDTLSLVGNLFYQVPEVGRSTASFALLRRTTLGVLTSPIREPSVLDRWSPYEIALFEAGICMYGKDFGLLSSLVGTKSTRDVIAFYYVWKLGKNYAQWKATYTTPAADAADD